ncbi:uncharacterized protein N7518_003797 [Penicillium psychrosexuale]|uniref:uncharacterized protein n=1 Tax=Penicillium psychrosexuale TaxID=1002107 RepID=UPI00254568B9|nr:uncharacterized protein N7518_003797 [Penicillium psychrosexuale]KAJ5801729.1 hypothetical protein N7518_003797 [Penicillium psychrosexuale]
MRGNKLEWELKARRKAKGKRKRKSTYIPGRQTIGKWQQGTAHDHDRKGVEAGMGKGHGIAMGSEQMGWESMGVCHGRAMRGGIRMSQALLT